ncbi:hypothetical protein ACLOJK_009826 [Asimina triloba]
MLINSVAFCCLAPHVHKKNGISRIRQIPSRAEHFFFCRRKYYGASPNASLRVVPVLDEFIMRMRAQAWQERSFFRFISSYLAPSSTRGELFDMSLREGAAVKNEDPPSPEKTPFFGSCRAALKSDGMLRWGPGRRTPIFRRQHEMQVQRFSRFSEQEEPDLEGDDDKSAVERPNVASTSKVCRKRKEARQNSKDRWSKERYISKTCRKIYNYSIVSAKTMGFRSRRYSSAELKLMDIMEAKGAVLGNPILRPELRAEARKHIGDTGLLDHLLKHMAGKVVPEKDVRFRRRHNPEGAMEYWLEPADLMDLRKQAGVQDPYWSPPPGWKPSDGLDGPDEHAACAKKMKKMWEETKKLREEMAIIGRKVEELFGKMQVPEVALAPGPAAAKETLSGSGCSGALQERHSSLQKGNRMLGEQLSELPNTLDGTQAEKRKLGEEAEEAKKADKAARSGFRRCKPEGTFVWPRNGWNSMPRLQVEDFLMVPTPTSATSSTSAPSLPWPPHQPSSPVKPQPKIVSVAQADNCRRKVFHYSSSTGMIASSAAYAVSGLVSLSSAHHDMRLLPVLSHPGRGESEDLLRSDAVAYSTSSTVTSANPPHPAATFAAASSESWLSL